MGVLLRDDPGLPKGARRAQAAPFNKVRTITASAERINLARTKPVQNRGATTWQKEAWAAYNQVGEIHQAVNLAASLLSRIRIYVGEVSATNEAPRDLADTNVETKTSKSLAADAQELLEDLTSSGFPTMVSKFSLNWTIPGECYLLKLPPDSTDELPEAEDQWVLASSSELTTKGNSIEYTPSTSDTSSKRTLPSNTYLARIWRQHPQYSKEPDSSLLALGDPVEELLLITKLVRGSIRSRMNAGILFIPDGITAPGTTTSDPPIEQANSTIDDLQNQAVEDPGNALLDHLTQALTNPISDEAAATGVVPILLTGPTDLGTTIRHIPFERPSDAWLVDRDTKQLDRIMSGIEVPKEVVTGMQAVKYSNAIVIDDSMYKATIEPTALNFVDSLTSCYLRPLLIAKGYKAEDIRKIVIWYDPSEIVTRPNAADDASEGYDRGVLSGKAWRREHGFSEADAPDEAELLRMTLWMMKTLPDTIAYEALKQVFGKEIDFDKLEEAKEEMAARFDMNTQDDAEAEVKQFPKAVPDKADPPADPQRTAIKQVGVK